MDDALAQALDELREEGLAVDVDDRTLRLVEPVKGDLGNAVLRALGTAEDATPVGAAARGAAGVAAAVWRSPELYVARWTRGRLWVVGYRLTGGARPSDYVRTEGRIPRRFETANWYGTVPEEVGEAFVEVGMLLDDPPFPVPAAPPAPPPRGPSAAAGRPPAASPAAPRRTAASRTPSRPPAARARAETTRVCASCRMHKAAAQFVAGSDLCVDCR